MIINDISKQKYYILMCKNFRIDHIAFESNFTAIFLLAEKKSKNFWLRRHLWSYVFMNFSFLHFWFLKYAKINIALWNFSGNFGVKIIIFNRYFTYYVIINWYISQLLALIWIKKWIINNLNIKFFEKRIDFQFHIFW